jgi:hypothetical protein
MAEILKLQGLAVEAPSAATTCVSWITTLFC